MIGTDGLGDLNKDTVLDIIIRARVRALKVHRVANITVLGEELPNRRATGRGALVGDNNTVLTRIDR